MTVYTTPATLRSALPRIERKRRKREVARLDGILARPHANPGHFGIQR